MRKVTPPANSLRERKIAWERRTTLLHLAADIVDADVHPEEIIKLAGRMESFVVRGEVPKAPVVELMSTPGTAPPWVTETTGSSNDLKAPQAT